MIKYLSLFSGIGAFESALRRLNIPFELINYCEIDKFASKSYSVIHNVSEEKNLGDITKIKYDKLDVNIDLITYGFPCQDISINGKQKGLFNDNGSLTRSGLFFEALKVIEYCKPKVAIAENVKNLTSKKFSTQFEIVLKSLEDAGYNNYWKVLNAKDYGIPQNRERVFIISIRKDVDTKLFEFPKPYTLEKSLKDFLQPHVDEKYYLNDAQTDRNVNNTVRFTKIEHNCTSENGIISTLMARGYKDPKCVLIGTLKGGKWDKTYERSRRIYSENGLSPALTTCVSGNTEVKVETNSQIRKLTPREYYRLMGFSDTEFDRAEKVNSNTQLYKQAGNSIVVDVLIEIFKSILTQNIL